MTGTSYTAAADKCLWVTQSSH